MAMMCGGQVRRELGRHSESAGAWSFAAVRTAERLVEIDLARIEPRLASPADAKDPVQVSLIGVAQCGGVASGLRVLADPGVEDPRVVRIGDHDRRGALAEGRLERLEIRVAVVVGHQGHDPVAGGGGTGTVTRVREDRGDHLVTLILAPFVEVPARHRGEPERCRGAPTGLERELVHAGDLAEDLGHPVADLQDAL